MKILWLINVPLPEASFLLKEKPIPFGGWLINASKNLSNEENMKLSITFPSKNVRKVEKLNGKKINYYPFPASKKYESKEKENSFFEEILQKTKPDIVHVYGTELPQTLSMVNTCNKLKIKTVISIQGLVSIYAKHIYADLPFRSVYGFTLRNLLRKDNIYWHRKTFEKRGKNEIEALRKTNHIIGRTSWDRSCTQQINPKAMYHFCNETLRGEFYNYKWDLNKCEKHTIFLSQGQYPIKGLHYMLEAMPIILKKFPQSKVYIGGKDITKTVTFKDRLLMTYYGNYIKKKIKSLELEDNVIFCGPLDEKQMCEKYLKSNVFVCPSTIENSPNSLGEAMILGVPSVASYVGGVPDMLNDNEEGLLYQHNAPYMLAHNICKIFENEDLALKFSENAKERALKTHDKIMNTHKLIEIYKSI